MYEESEQKLENIVLNQRNELKNQQERFNQAGNPEYDSIVKLEESMKNKINQIGKTLKESLLEQGNQTTEGSYPKPAVKVNFCTIMKEAKNEELAEESDKKLCACNIILHRVKKQAMITRRKLK